MPSYPGGPKQFVAKRDLVDRVEAEHVNSLQEEVAALESTIGYNPTVTVAQTPAATWSALPTKPPWSTIALRLSNIELGIVSDSHTQYVRKQGGDTVTPSTAATVGLAVRAATSQTADLLQFQDKDGNRVGGVSADGSITVKNITYTGVQTTTPAYTGAIDLTIPNGVIATSSNTGTGDKILLYASTHGFGVHGGQLVAYVPAGQAFAVRQRSASGPASSGTDAVALGANGTIMATGAASLKGGVDLSLAGGLNTVAGTALGDKASYYANTGIGMTDSTHLSFFLPTAASVLQVAPYNSGAGANSQSITPGAQFTGSGIANFKTDVRLANVPMPRGYLDSGVWTTARSTITTEVMLPEGTCTFTAVAGHSYRVTLTIALAGSNNDIFAQLRVRDGTSTASTQLATAITQTDITQGFGAITKTFVWLVQGLTAGAHSLTPSVANLVGGGGGSVYIVGSNGQQTNFMLVEHIGGPVQTSL